MGRLGWVGVACSSMIFVSRFFFCWFGFFFLLVASFLVDLEAAVMVFVIWWCRGVAAMMVVIDLGSEFGVLKRGTRDRE